MVENPYIPQDVGSEDYAAILETARKITTENRWLKEQAEHLTYQLKQEIEKAKAQEAEIKKLRTYVANEPEGSALRGRLRDAEETINFWESHHTDCGESEDPALD